MDHDHNDCYSDVDPVTDETVSEYHSRKTTHQKNDSSRELLFLPHDFHLGFHVGFSRDIGLYGAISQSSLKGFGCCQIYTGDNGDNFTKAKITVEDAIAAKDHMEEYDFRTYIHAHLRMNLARNMSPNMQVCLESDLRIANSAGISVIVHTGNAVKDGSPQKLVENIIEIRKHLERRPASSPQPFSLYLENSAGQGSAICTELKALGAVFDELHDEKIDVGLCIDTQHTYSAGQAELYTVKGVEKLFDKIDKYFPKDSFRVCHLNDSEVKYNARVDRHASIGEGFIWGTSTDHPTGTDSEEVDEALFTLLTRGAERGIDFILETPGQYSDAKYLYRFLSKKMLR